MTEEDLTSGLYTHGDTYTPLFFYIHTSLHEYMLIPHKHVHITHTHTHTHKSVIICVADWLGLRQNF